MSGYLMKADADTDKNPAKQFGYSPYRA